MYTYAATVLKVYDGDTITCDIDLGFGIHKIERIRLAEINAPEVRGKHKEAGLVSRDYLRDRILHKAIVLVTAKDKQGKYGRYLGHVYLDGANINRAMVIDGYAEVY